jgi:hypothetical protein
MNASANAKERAQQPRLLTAQWLALVGPPLVWLLQFEARYALAGNERGTRGHFAMTAIGIVSLLVIALLGWVARRQWRHAAASPLDRMAGVGDRARFLGMLGLLSSALFFLAVAAQVLAEFFLEPGKS